ncbi:MAG: hypothetical protein ACOZF0_06940 [Thermodesulfobacteriota bacterium]
MIKGTTIVSTSAVDNIPSATFRPAATIIPAPTDQAPFWLSPAVYNRASRQVGYKILQMKQLRRCQIPELDAPLSHFKKCRLNGKIQDGSKRNIFQMKILGSQQDGHFGAFRKFGAFHSAVKIPKRKAAHADIHNLPHFCVLIPGNADGSAINTEADMLSTLHIFFGFYHGYVIDSHRSSSPPV